MAKDISKFLFRCDQKKVEMGYLENFETLKAHLEGLELSISGLVNKLTTFIAALNFYNAQSTTLDQLRKYRCQKSSDKYAKVKRRQTSPIRSVNKFFFLNTAILHSVPYMQ